MTQENQPDPIRSLAVNLNESSLMELSGQREQLRQFIAHSLKSEVDFGVIPGTPKPSLYKPGAEKLCKLFQLGSRIVRQEKEISLKDNFAMFTYTVEVYHLPTMTAIAQCEGSANSQEKKYSEDKRGNPRRVADQINTLQKMAQKRAYVGAVIIATGASDFFTQDVEDMDLDQEVHQSRPAAKSAPEGVACMLCGKHMLLGKSGKNYYCPNFRDKSQGEHSIVGVEEVQYYVEELNRRKKISGGTL